MDTWKTSVNELLGIFRMALLALLPAMEAARIPTDEGEAYDEWDEISQSLYRNVVVRTLHWVHGGETALDDLLPPYNMKVQSYRDRTVLLVSGPQVNGTAIFVGLSSIDERFDTVDCVHVDEVGNIVGEPVQQRFRDTVFSFAGKLGSAQTITDFSVEL